MFDLFSKHPKARFSYAVTTGTYVGEILIFIEKTNDYYGFLSIPKMINRTIPCSKFNDGLKWKILDILQRIPKPVYKVCECQYKKNSTCLK